LRQDSIRVTFEVADEAAGGWPGEATELPSEESNELYSEPVPSDSPLSWMQKSGCGKWNRALAWKFRTSSLISKRERERKFRGGVECSSAEREGVVSDIISGGTPGKFGAGFWIKTLSNKEVSGGQKEIKVSVDQKLLVEPGNVKLVTKYDL
jgi:hypothetical protein